MKNTFGNNISVTLFGESHGKGIGAVIDGLPGGIRVDEDFIRHQLSLRRPAGKISTPRQEKDEFIIYSGVFEGCTTGAPICIVIPNNDTNSKDYSDNRAKARPSHADFTAFIKYNGFEDYRGGGHFSGRITAALVAAAAILISALKQKGILIGTHIKKLTEVFDSEFYDYRSEIEAINKKTFALIDDSKREEIEENILKARRMGDSVGGILETAVVGLPVGIGEPWFDSLEGVLSHAVFSVPAVKGIEFGAGFSFADMKGSEANDGFYMSGDEVKTKTNNNGGINGGISNGMPIVFKTVIKPTPTISIEQQTVDFIKKEDTVIASRGRHDPCIVHRARVVLDSVVAFALCDMLSQKYGTDWLAK